MLSVPFFLKHLVIVILFVVLVTCMAVALLESTPILICHMVTLFAVFISFTSFTFHAIYVILSLYFRDISSILFFSFFSAPSLCVSINNNNNNKKKKKKKKRIIKRIIIIIS